MQDKFVKTTLSTVEVDDIYKYEVKATIDGANELITLDNHHKNTKNDIDERSSFTISYRDLKQLMHIIKDEVAN